jgi:hypothetical protein
VQNWVSKNPAAIVSRRLTKKSGSDDVETAWAKARLDQAKQIKAQLAFVGTEGVSRLYLDGVVLWHEFHMKVRLGHASKYEVLFARDPTARRDVEGGAGFGAEEDMVPHYRHHGPCRT